MYSEQGRGQDRQNTEPSQYSLLVEEGEGTIIKQTGKTEKQCPSTYAKEKSKAGKIHRESKVPEENVRFQIGWSGTESQRRGNLSNSLKELRRLPFQYEINLENRKL